MVLLGVIENYCNEKLKPAMTIMRLSICYIVDQCPGNFREI